LYPVFQKRIREYPEAGARAGFYKQVNDSFGHDVGEKVPRAIAQVAMNSLKNLGVFCALAGAARNWSPRYRVMA